MLEESERERQKLQEYINEMALEHQAQILQQKEAYDEIIDTKDKIIEEVVEETKALREEIGALKQKAHEEIAALNNKMRREISVRDERIRNLTETTIG